MRIRHLQVQQKFPFDFFLLGRFFFPQRAKVKRAKNEHVHSCDPVRIVRGKSNAPATKIERA